MYIELWFKTLEERDHFEETGMKDSKIFKWIIKKFYRVRGMFIRGRTRTRVFCSENILEFLISIKWEKCID
jgi:hypothetical protein